ncbi:FecR family protein [Dyadobacter beijingensis]|nr:FecR domain-containing protein [Dyadobacter beijingensis]
MHQQQARALLEKYRLGRCTAEEKALIERWYAETARRRSKDPIHTDLQAAGQHSWRKILATLQPEEAFEARIRPLRAFYVAAAVAAAICLGFFWLYNELLTPGNRAGQMVIVHTRPGEIKTYTLPDSSHVTLNGGTSLRYPHDFEIRKVTISDGEAYFDVRHDASRPFIVEAGRTLTQVLGTVFSVRAYQRLGDIRVVVSSGKVGVRNSDGYPSVETAFLLPDEELVVDNQNGSYRKDHVNARSLAGWIKGALDFNNDELKTIALLLEKKFNVPVRVDGRQLEMQRLTARFRADETLDDILGTLSFAGNFKYRHDAGQVFISMK